MKLNFLARDGSRILQRLSTEQRKIIIHKMASNLIDHSKDILQANKRDLEEASKEGRDLLLKSFIGCPMFCTTPFRTRV
jgi:gamma-glutamyl phosphate reductase